MIAFLCFVAAVHDGDTLRCASGERVRIAGIEANELRGGCHLPRCAPLSGPAARAVATRLVLRRTLRCEALGRSYARVVARCSLEGRDIGCAFVAAGAAVEWPRYRRQLGLGPCRARARVRP
ncbi:MAG: thermonuclease family protein [Sphingomonas sp.]|nr:thermonuclease family protein [Sphingomonas sp.]